jgi:hypothetical protein
MEIVLPHLHGFMRRGASDDDPMEFICSAIGRNVRLK